MREVIAMIAAVALSIFIGWIFGQGSAAYDCTHTGMFYLDGTAFTCEVKK